MPTRKPVPKQRSQSEDFIETARKLGSDESREGFEQTFKAVTSHSIKSGSKKDKPKEE